MKTSVAMDIGFSRFYFMAYGGGGLESLNDVKIDELRTKNEVKMTKDNDQYVIIDHIRRQGTTGPYAMLKLVADNNNYLISITSSLKINSPIDDELSFYKWLSKINQGASCSTSYDESTKTINTEAYISFRGYEIWIEQTHKDPDEEWPSYSCSPEIDGFLNLLLQVEGRINIVSKEIAVYKDIQL